MAVWTLLFGFAQPICFVILVAFVLSFVLASRPTKRMYRIAENAVDSLEVAATALDVEVTIGGSDAPIRAIPQLLYSIVYNLCDNGIKYNHSGGSVEVNSEVGKGTDLTSIKRQLVS